MRPAGRQRERDSHLHVYDTNEEPLTGMGRARDGGEESEAQRGRETAELVGEQRQEPSLKV